MANAGSEHTAANFSSKLLLPIPQSPTVILEIFRRHARTKEAQLQVELARLKYLAPRERLSGAKERKGGGRGGRGVSESFHETGRREVRDRISELQRELKAVHREQVERRRHREG